MPQFQPYVMFDGNCADAMKFYEQALGGKIQAMMRYADAPQGQAGGAPCPAGAEDRIMHGRLDVDGSILMASDMPPGQFKGNHGISLVMNYDDVAHGKRVFEAMSAGGQVFMPMGETFWVECFGMLVDRFGIHWMINAGKPKMPPPSQA